MGEQREKLILGRIRADELLAQRHVARLVFDEVEDALDGLLGCLQPEEIHIHEACHAAPVREGLLHELKRRPEREHLLDRFRGRDLHRVVTRIENLPVFGQLAEAFRHIFKRLIGLQEVPRLGIDQGDAARHVRQDLLIENYFALDPPRRFGLASGKFSREPRRQRRENDEPDRRDRDLVPQIAQRFVGRRRWLLDDRHPAGRVDGREGIDVSVLFEISRFVFANLLNQRLGLRGNPAFCRREILREESVARLIEHLANRLVRELDRGKPAPDAFHQNRHAEKSNDASILCADRAHDVRAHALVGKPRMDRRNVNVRRCHRAFPPKIGREVLRERRRNGRQRCDQPALASG